VRQRAGTARQAEIGATVRRIRLEQGLTQAQLAARLDVSRQTVWAWETNRSRPQPLMRARLLGLLDLPGDPPLILEQARTARNRSVTLVAWADSLAREIAAFRSIAAAGLDDAVEPTGCAHLDRGPL